MDTKNNSSKLKKVFFIFIILLILILLIAISTSAFANKTANKENVKILIGNSEIYSKEELNEAVKVVLDTFDFPATLNEIYYDEVKSLSNSNKYATQYGVDEAIILYCNFTTYSNTDIGFLMPGPLNPNSEYTDYNFVLVRNDNEAWELKTSGY